MSPRGFGWTMWMNEKSHRWMKMRRKSSSSWAPSTSFLSFTHRRCFNRRIGDRFLKNKTLRRWRNKQEHQERQTYLFQLQLQLQRQHRRQWHRSQVQVLGCKSTLPNRSSSLHSCEVLSSSPFLPPIYILHVHFHLFILFWATRVIEVFPVFCGIIGRSCKVGQTTQASRLRVKYIYIYIYSNLIGDFGTVCEVGVPVCEVE